MSIEKQTEITACISNKITPPKVVFSPLNQRFVDFLRIRPYNITERRHHMDQAKIGKFIAECRKKEGLTQMQLAEKLGITDRAVSKWETGDSLN